LNSPISIVTINFNNAVGLQKTIASVLNQTVKPHEFIIVDGASTDGSVEILKSRSDKNVTWTSEPDKGIYNAHNKGLRRVTGEYVLFLNSGDELVNAEILEKVSPFLTEMDLIYGDLIIVESSREWIKKYNEPVSFGYFLGDTFPHQGTFIKKAIFEKTGYFDETLKLSSDWKFFIEAVCRHNASLQYLDFVVARYDYSGVSSDPENRKKMESEKHSILEREFPRFFDEYKELFLLRSKYPLLANSRAVRIYFKIRNLFVNSNH
jgi:glycosyltransferase involved in cell wall biosynthesis